MPERSSDKYRKVNEIVPRMRNEEHYQVDEKGHSVTLTDEGVELAEKLLKEGKLIEGENLYDPVNLETLHILNQCLRAHTLYKRDVNYMVKDGEVLIIDEFTGRVLRGRRWSDGLHQAVEAKENVTIKEENRTLATIPFQNLFRIYKKLAGMTGTADTEAAEFDATYSLRVTVIPTNQDMVRTDEDDVVYKTEREKFTAVVDDIMENHKKGVPILVGTTSVEKSAAISRILTKKDIPHNVLNAKHHENEAYIVAQAGQLGAITVSTNMAGRGTDIVLGGNPEMISKLKFRDEGRDPKDDPEGFEALVDELDKECFEQREKVVELGGLYIVGTERHEARRIDNQLRGRAGRQGDPGRSRFYLSLEDDLMRIFAGDRVKNLMERMGMPDNEPIEHPWVTKSVENAQKKVEERNFDIRKNLLEYDDVMNEQRKTVYRLRQELLSGRYSAEVLDDEGKPSGETRTVPVPKDVTEQVERDLGLLLGMFCEDPLMPRDQEGELRVIKRKEFKKAKLVELDTLQKEIYARWGVVVEFGKKKALDVYDECLELVPQALAEQRDRLLDLLDRVIGAIVEDSCPLNRAPDDWDWNSIFEGFEQHFGVELPEDIADYGDRDSLARELYERAEAVFLDKEKELGRELTLRVFRHIYLEDLDRQWVDHLTDMDHLRQGIGLRGYGQKDPKQEYKKEGYNMFVTLLARTSSNVVTKLMKAQVRRSEEEEMIEAEDLARHMEELQGAVARHGGQVQPLSSPGAAEEPAVLGDQPCPCGSGKPFRECHGSDLEEERDAAPL
jgi:preprotein translocase subunit SecA